MTMILRSSGASPFGRKVKIAASLTGTGDALTVEDADPMSSDDSIREQNPLGKIPALVLDDARVLFDSRVICGYLDHIGNQSLHPAGPALWDAMRLQALGDGMMDAAILLVYEKRMRPPEKHHAPWQEHQQGKVDRSLAALEAKPPICGTPPNIGDVTLACALGYLDLRFDGTWRNSHPALVAWLEAFAADVPAFESTRFTG